MIDTSKETYQQYRERARDLYDRCAVLHGDSHGTNELVEQVKIPLHANVMICEGGAFIEAVVWVPASNLHRPAPIKETSVAGFGTLGAVEEHQAVMDVVEGKE